MIQSAQPFGHYQMMLDAEVTAYPHERKQPYIN